MGSVLASTRTHYRLRSMSRELSSLSVQRVGKDRSCHVHRRPARDPRRRAWHGAQPSPHAQPNLAAAGTAVLADLSFQTGKRKRGKERESGRKSCLPVPIEDAETAMPSPQFQKPQPLNTSAYCHSADGEAWLF